MTSKIVVNNIESDSGISSVTFTSDIELGTKNLKGHNLESTGIVTAVSFTGSGANLTNIPAGNLSGTLPALDGSALTGVGLGTDGSANTSGIITATAFVPTTGQLSHRNLIINGDMMVAQRGTSSTSSGYHTVDRFSVEDGGVNEATTKEQVAVTSGGAYDSGFRNCLKITNGNQTSGAGGSDYVQIMQRFEGQDIANSGWNYTSSSSFITFSFWVKSSVAQAFSGSLRSHDGTSYSYKFDTPSLSANTWTKVTKTILGNSNLTFDDDNGNCLSLHLYPFIGTSLTTPNSDTETWVTGTSGNYANDMTSTWYTTNDATFETTGWQLEVGSVATPFEHISFAENKRRCYRYCQRGRHVSSCLVGTPGTYYFSRGNINLFTPMRATVTGTLKAATWNSNRYFKYMTWSSETNVTAAPASTTFASGNISDATSDILSVNLHISISSGSSNSPLPANGPGSNNVYPIEYFDVLLEAEL